MKLSQGLKSKNINFKNRVIMPPMATAKADENGHIKDEILNYYEEKTENKLFSTVIIEHSFVDVLGKASKNQTSIADDSTIDGMKKLANLVKANGSSVVLQISHAGSSTNEEVIGQQPVAPSAIKNPSKSTAELPRELSAEEIEQIIDKFVDAAVRSKEAGFDGVEIHSAHGYLLNQFLSPLTNKRTDEYGGDIDGRIKIHLEIIRKIREKVGNEYPIFIRIGAGDYLDGGLSTEDSIHAAVEFVKAGADVLDISGGMCMFSIDNTKAGFFDFLSKPIFENVDVPVILTGGVKTGDDVEDILNRGVCDLVGVGRSVFKDSNWMNEQIKPIM